MQKIVPFLWFENSAEEAVNFYISVFKNAKTGKIMRYGDVGPGLKGTVMSAEFQIEGQDFIALNGGPYFTYSPAVSLFVNCRTSEELDELWNSLSEGGKVLMELDRYPFGERYGWFFDRFGVPWQLNLSFSTQKIMPFLMFTGEQQGKAEEAINFYTSIFKNSNIAEIEHCGKGGNGPEGIIKRATFSLEGQEFMAIDSNQEHSFPFKQAISFFVNCETQDEVDELWEKLSDGGEKIQCGWLADKFGMPWQIVPTILGKMLSDEVTEKSNRVMEAMLKMNKIDIETLKRAYDQG